MDSISQILDERAAQRAQEYLDAEQGNALANALAWKYYQQGYTAAEMNLTPSQADCWTPDHQRGYNAAQRGRQLFLLDAGAPAVYRGEQPLGAWQS